MRIERVVVTVVDDNDNEIVPGCYVDLVYDDWGALVDGRVDEKYYGRDFARGLAAIIGIPAEAPTSRPSEG